MAVRKTGVAKCLLLFTIHLLPRIFLPAERCAVKNEGSCTGFAKWSLLLFAIHLFVSAAVSAELKLAGLFTDLEWFERWREIRRSWAVVLLIGIVLGGITFGVFTATEGAAVGAALAFFFALGRRALNGKKFWNTLTDVASTSGMIYVIIIGASIFSYFVAVSHAPEAMIKAISGSGLSIPVIMFLLMLMYLVLGAIFDEVAAMVITMPFVLPLIKSWGFDPVWWGIINVVIIELGMLIPPIGMNVFVIHGLAPTVSLAAIYRGVMPYIASNLVRLALLLSVPALCLWLPAVMKD